jgi:tripartite-type tricarboxylate transporter receptor subunit TctC
MRTDKSPSMEHLVRLKSDFPAAHVTLCVWLVVLAGVLSAACSGSAAATGAAEAFRGQTIYIVVGFAAGGGYDLQARVLARHLGRHLPGEPVVVVENEPGAGGLIAANYLARRARPDALTVGFLGLFTVLPQLIEQPGVQYDARRFPVIGSAMAEDVDVCLTPRTSRLDLSTWRSRAVPPRMGVTTYGSANHARAMLLSAALDLPVRTVVGYKGMSDIRLAMESGEVEATCVGLDSYRATFEASDKYMIVLQSGDDPSPVLRGVPSAARLVQNAHGTALLNVLSQLRTLDRFYAVPPDTPRDRVDLLRVAFEHTMHDEAFLGEARAARLEIRPGAAEEIESRVRSVLNLPDAARREVAALLSERVAR